MRSAQFFRRAAALWLVAGFMTQTSEASQELSFFATLSNASDGQERCLGFPLDGEGHYLERLHGDGGGPCGLSDQDELLRNRQALWRITPLGEGDYVLENASQELGAYACLLFANDGAADYPTRYSWGPGEACGYPGGVPALRQSRLGIWRLEPLGNDLYTLINRSRDPGGECLIFGGGGTFIKPERYNWGAGPYCGFPGGRDALLQNRQAVFKIDRLALDSEAVPASWSDGYLMLQNALLPNQVLGADPAGYGPYRAEWWHDDNARFDLQPSGEGNYFFLENARSGKRLHVGHDGNGQLYSAFAGDDDAYRFFLEESDYEDRYLFRSKLYPDQRLAVAADGTGVVMASTADEARAEWLVTEAASANSPTQVPFRSFREIEGQPLRHYELIFQNKLYPHQRLHVGHDGNGLLYAEAGAYEDLAYRWTARIDDSFFSLKNRNNDHQELFAGHPGEQPTARPGGPAGLYQWELEPAPGNWFFLRNPETDKRLHVGHDGNGELYTAAGQLDDAYQWHLMLFPGETRFLGNIGEDRQCPGNSGDYDLSVKLCLYDGFDQTGFRMCRILQHSFERYEKHRIDLGLWGRQVTATRSISIEDCNRPYEPPTVLLFDQSDFKSDTTVVEHGGGNVNDDVLGNLHSLRIAPHNTQYLCLYRGHYQTGRRTCAFVPTGGAVGLAPDWNDKVGSVGMSPNWVCKTLRVYQHNPSGGQSIDIGGDENLVHRPLVDMSSADPSEWVFGNWATQVSGFFVFRPWLVC